MEIDRRILIFDGPEGELQQLAMDLIGREFEVHYANDIDEAQMMTHEAEGRINTIVFAARSLSRYVPDMATRFGLPAAALIPGGARPDAEVVDALLEQGVKWHLWDDPPDEQIRMVISSVLFEHDPLEIRYHGRVPTSLSGHLEIRGVKCDTSIRDISHGGACLLGDLVGEQNDEGLLRFSHGDDDIALPIRIAWIMSDSGEGPGVAGVSFVEITPSAGQAIDALIHAAIARHRIQKT